VASLREEFAKRIIDPQALIKQAESQAEAMVSLISNQESSDKPDSFTVDSSVPVTKQAEDILAAIDNYVAEEGNNSKPKIAISKEEMKKGNETVINKTGIGKNQEKSAAAKLLELSIIDDLITDALVKKAIINVGSIDLNAMNERVAEKLGKISFTRFKKPLARVAGAAGLTGAGYFGGIIKGKKRLKDYVAADARQDQINAQRAYRYGQLAMYQRLAGAAAGGSNG